MEALGCEFDDSVFDAFRERKTAPGIKPGSYRAKVCEAGKALCEYSSSLDLVPVSNIALRRDLQEAQARCLCFLGRPEDALDLAQKLRAEVTNTDHLTAVLNLDILIYRNAGNLSHELCCLQQLVSLHPFNPWYWRKLAESYLGLAQAILSTTVSMVPVYKDGHCRGMSEKTAVETETSKTKADFSKPQKLSKGPSVQVGYKRRTISPRNAPEEENSDPTLTSNLKEPSGTGDVASFCSAVDRNMEIDSKSGQQLREQWLFACSSFVRARLLLQMVKPQQASFVLERNLTVQEEIRQQLSELELREEALNAISKTMGEDLLPDRFKNGAETERPVTFPNSSSLTCVAIESGFDFEKRWFKKLIRESFHGPTSKVKQGGKEKIFGKSEPSLTSAEDCESDPVFMADNEGTPGPKSRASLAKEMKHHAENADF
ncbi:zinc fingers and homeoboxes protein 1 isoform X2 [Carcharodon carcharias]|uniref:zinc fingers and homeoboxes protein 1 isoform X2 n=1 Tax=Carcharodon carcharias TaxID=13397 RepID=UPI001B7E50D1|nr:zinc fingers and homeoboxes protein 1 isoform X2 [Carcharodon carcharias]